MAQSTAPAEPHILPPPIPIRSHLRDGSVYQQKIRAIHSTSTNPESAPLSTVSHTLFEELDRELVETKQRLVSAIWEDNEQESDTMTKTRRLGETLGNFYSSEAGSEVSYHDDRHNQLQSDSAKVHSTASSTYSQHNTGERSEYLVGRIEVQGCVPSLRGSRDGTTSATHTNHASCSDNTSPSSNYSVERMDTKVSDWLARGFLSSGSDEPGPDLVTSTSDRPFLPRHANLSLFPPTSASTGNREYTPPGSPFARTAWPMSPLNNGRDAYGNYISSNKRDYCTAQSPPTSPIVQTISDRPNLGKQGSSSPIVRLRGGGWNGFKPFWKTSNTEELDQSQNSTSLQNYVDKDDLVPGPSAVNYAAHLESRTPPSVRSLFSTSHGGKIQRTTEGALGNQSAVDTRRDNQFHNVVSNVRPGSNTPDSADTDDSSIRRARADAVVYQHFGPQLSPSVPIFPGIRPITNQKHPEIYGRSDVSPMDGPRSPPIDKNFAPTNFRSALSVEDDYTSYSMSPSPLLAKTGPTSWDVVESQEIQETDSTVGSHVASPRENKRWDRTHPPPPPRHPLPNPPRYLRAEPPKDDAFEDPDDDSHRAPSTLSANTLENKLIDMLGLKETDAYRRIEHERSVQRIQSERQRLEEVDPTRQANVRRQEGLQQRESDLSTIVPGDSVTAVIRRQPIERRHGLERIAALNEHLPKSPSPSQYLPRHGRITAKAHAMPQQRNEQYRTIGYPSVVPASVSVEPTSVKRQNTLQTVISKAGKFTRLILAAPSEAKYKTYSQRYPPRQNEEKKSSGLSADTTGWPRNGKSFSTATHGMLISTQTTDPGIMASHDQPQNSGNSRKQSDNRGWEHPRGRKVKVGKTESKRPERKWRKRSHEKTTVQDTNRTNFAFRDVRRGKSSDILATKVNTQNARSRGATRLQHPGFARSGPRARSTSPKASKPVTGCHTVPISSPVTQHPPKHTSIPSNAAGTPQTRFGLQDKEGKCYARRDDGEVLPSTSTLGYPYHWTLNTYYDVDSPDAATLKWLEGIRTQADEFAETAINMRGGGGFPTNDGEANSLASLHRLLTSASLSLNSGNETIDSSDTDALLVSSTHLELHRVTHEAIASVNRNNGDDTRPSSDQANVRSSFSTDSTVDLRRKKKARENVWRNEDRARAMAMAMHSIG